MATRAQPLKDHWKEQRLFFSRIIGASVVVVMLTGVLVWQLVDLQVVHHQQFSAESRGNQIDIEPLPPMRGEILDRNGRILATNEPAWQLVAVRENITDLEAVLMELEELKLLESANRPSLIESVRSSRSWEPVLLANLNEIQAASFAARGHMFQGVDLQAGLVRFYPEQRATAHSIGYVGRPNADDVDRMSDPDNYSGTLQIGKTGIERRYEDRLHGTVGRQAFVVDAHRRPTGQPVPDGLAETVLPVPGEHVILALDIDMQRAAVAALAGLRGAAVVIDPRNGDVLTMVSMPAFDPNSFSTGMSTDEYSALSSDPNEPFRNRVLAEQYNPGSTVKPFFGLAGLHYETGFVAEDHVCNGQYHLPNSTHVWRESRRVLPHGETSLHSAIVRSCNVYFYGLGEELGIDRMQEFLGKFGFGSRTGIDIGGEYAGVNPGVDWKRESFRNAEDKVWFPGETINNAIGQGYIEVTPLQLAHATATLAAQGQRFRPRLLIQTEDAGTGAVTNVPAEALEPVSGVDALHWQLVHEAMLGVTAEPRGTGFKSMNDADFTVAAKTGTAQVIGVADGEFYDEDAIDERYKDNGLFVAFAPAVNPQVAIAVVVENQGGGGSTAAPVARIILDTFFGNTEYVAQLVAY